MPLPVILAADESGDALGVVESQLIQRYAHDYRVLCLSDPGAALQKLTELASADQDVALVLAGTPQVSMVRNGLLDRVRELHPHAKRALLVPLHVWADKAAAEAVRASIALGGADYYVVRPAASRDEVFHEAVSSFLLEWATERRAVPHTVHIVGEAWSGRAYELREVFGRCAVPHAFCLADSPEGRGLLARAGPGAKLPLMVLPGGRVLSDPSNAEIAEAAGATRQVVLLVRAYSLQAGMSDYLIRAIDAAPNVEVRTCTTVAGGGGEGRLQQLVLRDGRTGAQETVTADALFVLIGAHPRTDWLPPEIARDAHGFLLAGEEFADGGNWPLKRRPYPLETSMPGVIAAGDVRHSSIKRVASAVGEGSIAIQIAQAILAGEHAASGTAVPQQAGHHLAHRPSR